MTNQEEFELLLGVKLEVDKNGVAYTRCPFHKEDNLALEVDTQAGICFCHAGCGGAFSDGLAMSLGKLYLLEEVSNETRD